VAEMIIYDLFLFKLPLATLPTIITTAASANSATSIFGDRNFHSRCIGYEKLVPEMESTYGAGV